MSKLYATIWTDEEVINYLNNYSDVVSITTRYDGGLDIDVKSKVFHNDTSDYSRIKNFLRKNGFTSFVGVHSRRKVLNSIRGTEFKLDYLTSDNQLKLIIEEMKKNNH